MAGGKSSRLGRDKALLQVSGRALALRVAEAVLEAAGGVTLVGSPEKYGGLGYRVLPDAVVGAGPLGGVLAALEDSVHDWNLITACDLPGIHAEFLRFLLRRTEQVTVDVILPLNRNGMPEPLCAVYHRRTAGAIRRSVQSGIFKVTRAFHELDVARIDAGEYAEYDRDGRLFANINTVEDAREAGLIE